VFIYLDAGSQVEGEMAVVPSVVGLEMDVGEEFIREALFTPVTFIDRPESGADITMGDPVTTYPTLIDRDNTEDTVQGVIYQQFPAPGLYIQKGTEIKLKVRIE
jgi:hypothetical protein